MAVLESMSEQDCNLACKDGWIPRPPAEAAKEPKVIQARFDDFFEGLDNQSGGTFFRPTDRVSRTRISFRDFPRREFDPEQFDAAWIADVRSNRIYRSLRKV